MEELFFEERPYKVSKNKLFITENGYERPISDAVYIKCVWKSIETKELSLTLCFYSYGDWQEITIKRSQLMKKELQKLASKGLDVINDYQAKAISEFLVKQEKSLTPILYHKSIGWDSLDNQLIFKHKDLISKNASVKSVYKGNLDLSHASTEDWWRFYHTNIAGYAPLEMILCVSISALVVGMLNVTAKANLETLVVHLVGQSTSGKTTAAQLAVSMYANPLSSSTLFKSYNGTKNALSQQLVGNHGSILVYDESTMNLMKKDAMSAFIYEVTQNVEKSRLNENAELLPVDRWSTTVLSTGETSILENTNQNEGLRVRLIEFKDVKWTRDATHAQNLKNGASSFFGWVAPQIAKKMLQLGPQRIKEMLDENTEDIKLKLTDSPFKERLAGKYALLWTASELITETFNRMQFDVDKHINMILDNDKQVTKDLNIANKFHDIMRGYVVEHQNHFINDRQKPVGSVYGKVEVKNDQTICYLLPKKYSEVARENGFKNETHLLTELKRCGYLLYDSGKNKKRKVIEGIETNNINGNYYIALIFKGDILNS